MKRILCIALLVIILVSVLCVPALASSYSGPRIIEQPQDYTCNSGNFVFRCYAVGEGITYLWEWYYVTGGGWTPVGDGRYTEPVMSFPGTEARDGRRYRCVITDTYGNQAISDVAVFHYGEPVDSNVQSNTFWDRIVNSLGKFFDNLAIPYEISQVFDTLVGIWGVIPAAIRFTIIMCFSVACFFAVAKMLF